MFTHSTDKCYNCGNETSLITDIQEGTIVCTACGVVQKTNIIDEQFESRNIKEENGGHQSQSRIGGPIDTEYFNDISGQIVIGKGRNKKLKDRNYTAMPSKEVNLRKLFKLTDEIASQLGIHKVVVDQMKPVLNLLVQEKKISKRNQLATLSIVFKKVCFNEKIPLDINRLTSLLKLNLKDLRKAGNKIIPIIPNKFKEEGAYKNQFTLNSYILYNNKNLPFINRENQKIIAEIGEFVINDGMLEGKNPQTVVASVFNLFAMLYKIEGIDAESLSKACKLTKKTINDGTNILISKKAKFPEKFQQLFK